MERGTYASSRAPAERREPIAESLLQRLRCDLRGDRRAIFRQLLAQLGARAGEDRHREQRGVRGAADRDGRHRHAFRHLHDRQQRIETVERLALHRHADHRQNRLGRDASIAADLRELVTEHFQKARARWETRKAWSVTVPLPVWDEYARESRVTRRAQAWLPTPVRAGNSPTVTTSHSTELRGGVPAPFAIPLQLVSLTPILARLYPFIIICVPIDRQ